MEETVLEETVLVDTVWVYTVLVYTVLVYTMGSDISASDLDVSYKMNSKYRLGLFARYLTSRHCDKVVQKLSARNNLAMWAFKTSDMVLMWENIKMILMRAY